MHSVFFVRFGVKFNIIVSLCFISEPAKEVDRRAVPMLSSLLLQLPEDRRYFLQLFISVLVSVGNGSIFCFGIFSPYMKQPAFSMSQKKNKDMRVPLFCFVLDFFCARASPLSHLCCL
ncbi:transmembrane protein, putative [Bodo saltans]|uniref:Transmembrane protein, putative n=1 Tax=Bodo saltans TaxID=75058 RepID=A0A0S4KP87_BODSA|nr:transmembrane protein, putative [Bodo saltans]|eukprot:CUM57964.1 transmembrane protein, putative [Bodo saltans]